MPPIPPPPLAPPLAPVTPATARKRRWRAQRVAGGRTLLVPVKDRVGAIEMLLDLRWADEAQSRNQKEIGRAAGRFLDDLISWANAMRQRDGPAWTDTIEFPWSGRDHEQ